MKDKLRDMRSRSPKYRELQKGALDMVEGDIRCQRDWADALLRGDKERMNSYPKRLLDSEFGASDEFITAEDKLGFNTTADSKQLENDRRHAAELEVEREKKLRDEARGAKQ